MHLYLYLKKNTTDKISRRKKFIGSRRNILFDSNPDPDSKLPNKLVKLELKSKIIDRFNTRTAMLKLISFDGSKKHARKAA